MSHTFLCVSYHEKLRKSMANTSIYNYRIYPKEKRKISLEDYQLVKSLLFDNPRWINDYDNGILKSYSTPLIFETTSNEDCIEMLIEPYKNTDFLRNIDEILELNKFDIWTIAMFEVDDINCIYRQSSLKNLDTSRNCKFKYDRIKIQLNMDFNSNLFLWDRINIPITGNEILEYAKYGEYHSSICIGGNIDEMHCSFNDKKELKEKDDISYFSYGKVSEPTGWYLDDRVYILMKNLKNYQGIEKVEFFYEERRTRLYENPDLTEGFMFDDWSNCADKEFEEYIKERTR